MESRKTSNETRVIPYLEGSVVKILVEDRKSPLRKEEFGFITDTSVGTDGNHEYTVEPQDSERMACWAYRHSELELYRPAYVVPPAPPSLSSKTAVSAKQPQPVTVKPPLMPESAQKEQESSVLASRTVKT
jgi:hypothetical protein